MLSIGLWRWYINKTIAILDNIHRRLYSASIFRCNLHWWTQSTSCCWLVLFCWTYVSRFHLKTETNASLQNVIFFKKTRRWIMSKRSIWFVIFILSWLYYSRWTSYMAWKCGYRWDVLWIDCLGYGHLNNAHMFLRRKKPLTFTNNYLFAKSKVK
jgi:hypothetical protein